MKWVYWITGFVLAVLYKGEIGDDSMLSNAISVAILGVFSFLGWRADVKIKGQRQAKRDEEAQALADKLMEPGQHKKDLQ